MLVFALRNDRALALSQELRRARITGVGGMHVAFEHKDAALCPPGQITVSTVHSAKGYDAAVVLLCGANEFPTDVRGRAAFHVACTRAVEHLEVFAHAQVGLAAELAALLAPHAGASTIAERLGR